MLNKILMPSGGQTTDEMMILNWNKQVGDTVSRGDILFEIETDKAILTVESFAEGTLLEIKSPAGGMAKVGEVVALIGNKDDMEKSEDDNNILLSTANSNAGADSIAADDTRSTLASASIVPASPLARKMAEAENISLADIFERTGGRVIKKADVEMFVSEAKQNKLPSPIITGVKESDNENDFTLINVLPIRKTIARRMVESLSLAPHYVISIDVDMTSAISMREKLNQHAEKTGCKVSYNDILMKVISSAVHNYPLVNSTFLGDRVKLFKNVNVGLAVATDAGIVVPVVKEVNKKNIIEIARQNTANIMKVRSAQLQEADMHGGTITISNLGMFGINNFTAIINQPESCILAVGAIQRKPVADAVSDNIVLKPIMTITGSFDHRIIDGAVGAPFLENVKGLLEDPILLL